jgi:hypothetical protein
VLTGVALHPREIKFNKRGETREKKLEKKNLIFFEAKDESVEKQI